MEQHDPARSPGMFGDTLKSDHYRSPLLKSDLEEGGGSGGNEEQMIMKILGAGQIGSDDDLKQAAKGSERPQGMYYSAIPMMGDQNGVPFKRFDAPRLKDYRKRLESGMMGQEEVDGMAIELIEDCAEVSFSPPYYPNRDKDKKLTKNS
jgi:hypothetical protein